MLDLDTLRRLNDVEPSVLTSLDTLAVLGVVREYHANLAIEQIEPGHFVEVKDESKSLSYNGLESFLPFKVDAEKAFVSIDFDGSSALVKAIDSFFYVKKGIVCLAEFTNSVLVVDENVVVNFLDRISNCLILVNRGSNKITLNVLSSPDKVKNVYVKGADVNMFRNVSLDGFNLL